jgi:hypothetical protein
MRTPDATGPLCRDDKLGFSKGVGALDKFEVSGPAGGELLSISAGVRVSCGTDRSRYLYRRLGVRWRRVAEDEQPRRASQAPDEWPPSPRRRCSMSRRRLQRRRNAVGDPRSRRRRNPVHDLDRRRRSRLRSVIYRYAIEKDRVRRIEPVAPTALEFLGELDRRRVERKRCLDGARSRRVRSAGPRASAW